jgi:transcription initiation factor IIF auxiliary subunit
MNKFTKILLSLLFFLFHYNYSNSQGLEFLDKATYLKIESPPISYSDNGDKNTIPSKYIITNLPPSKIQKGGSCTGWATGYAFMSYYIATKSGNIASEKPFSPTFVYNSIRQFRIESGKVVDCKERDCNCGTSIYDALQFLEKTGNVPFENFPVDACFIPNNSLKNIAQNFKIDNSKRVDDILNLGELKGYISEGIPVIIGVKLSHNFSEFKNKQSNDILYIDDINSKSAHAMMIVGYDDDMGQNGAFKIMNSWGDDWGHQGFVWIDYHSFKRMIREAYVVLGNYKKATINVPKNSTTITSNSFKPYGYKEEISGNRFNFTYGLRVAESAKESIEKVVYVFDHPTFTNKYVTSSKYPFYQTSYSGWGCLNNMKAIVYLKNGTSVPFDFNGCDVLQSNGNNDINSYQIVPIVTAEEAGYENKNQWYDFKIKLIGIENIKQRITKVTYAYNHNTMSNSTTYDKDNNFEEEYRGWGCFNDLEIYIYFNDGTQKKINLDMCEKLGW